MELALSVILLSCGGGRGKPLPYEKRAGKGDGIMHPERKSTRLKTYDYSTPGAYFITICTSERKSILSSIDVQSGELRLTEAGQYVDEQIRGLRERYPTVSADKYVIMPNHIHLILVLRDADGASVIDVIRALKSVVARKIGAGAFQRSFHDHVIRTEKDYRMIWDYIDTNPQKWAQDCFFCSG